MALGRDNTQRRKWTAWVDAHRAELYACGIPVALLEDEGSWSYFLDHGYFTPEGSSTPSIDVERLSTEEALRLCELLEREDVYSGVALNRLQFLLKRGPHATLLKA